MPLVRSDGLPTQHMRALAYWSAAPELDDVISMQVCGTEWVAHVTCRRKLIDATRGRQRQRQRQRQGRRPADPRRLPRHGRPRERIDQLQQGRGAADRRPGRVAGGGARGRPRAGRGAGAPPASRAVPAQVALGYFLLQPTTKQVEFEPGEAAAGGQGQPRLGPGPRPGPPRRRVSWPGERPAEDPDYRFAVVQSEHYRCHLAAPSRASTSLPLARYLSHFARWYRRRRAGAGGRGGRAAGARAGPAASGWRGPDEDAAGRQPRLLHLQRLPPAGGGLGRGAGGGQQRRRLLAGAD